MSFSNSNVMNGQLSLTNLEGDSLSSFVQVIPLFQVLSFSLYVCLCGQAIGTSKYSQCVRASLLVCLKCKEQSLVFDQIHR